MAVTEVARPKRLIEHGSGMSTHIFLRWKQFKMGEYLVWESNLAWREKLQEHLRELGLEFESTRLFREDFFEPFALFLDGPRDEREQVARMALPYAKHGIVLFDDANRQSVRDIAGLFAGGPGIVLDTSALTLDKHGRYAFLWVGDHFVDVLAELWESTNVTEAVIWP